MKAWFVLRWQNPPISLRLKRQLPVVLGLILILTVTAIAVSIAWGEYAISLLDVLKTLLGLETNNPDYEFIILTLRLPRAIAAWLVGIGLAVAGTIIQGITRNPLAAPGIIGINAGASLAVVTLLVLLPMSPASVLPWAAFAGACGVAAAIYLLAWREGCSPLRLILVGVGINLIASALTNLMVALGELNSVSQALIWLAGSVYGRSWPQVSALLPWVAIFTGFSLIWTRELNNLNLGDDLARSLGNRLERQRALLLLASIALAGASVATAGSVGFVGLIAPHLGRKLIGASYENLLPVAALMGGLLVVAADLVGRLLFAPLELPCGIVTAALGAPYFLYLLIRDRAS
jgi:iron complex transport system permease protein